MLVVRALVVTIVTCGMCVHLLDQGFHRISHSGRISMIPCVAAATAKRAHTQVLGFCKISFNTLGKFSLTFSGHRRMELRSIDLPDSNQFYDVANPRLKIHMQHTQRFVKNSPNLNSRIDRFARNWWRFSLIDSHLFFSISEWNTCNHTQNLSADDRRRQRRQRYSSDGGNTSSSGLFHRIYISNRFHEKNDSVK